MTGLSETAGQKERKEKGGESISLTLHFGHMPRVNAILRHPLYREWYQKLKETEESRIFCRHQMTHLLDTARIAYIIALEQRMSVEKEVIYAAAVLHDIGKQEQYENGIPHEISSERIAREILESFPENSPLPEKLSTEVTEKIVFTREEKDMILTAIRGHRKLRDGAEPLERLLYTADKASRTCFACPAEKECDWSREKKNMELSI